MSDRKPAAYLTELFGLSDKTAVVIGGTGVLGGAICDALASAGAHVLVVGRSAERGQAAVDRLKAAGGSGEFIAADSTSRTDLQAIVDHLKDANRHCDVLVNGAGINAATPFLEISDEEWNHIMSVNVTSVRIACQVFGGDMLERGTKGSIINIASVSAELPLSRVFTYSTSKAAVLSLTRNLGREWATQGIRVNALSPGFFPAEQNRKVLTADRIASVMKHTPVDRFGEPHELAGAVLLLASNNAGSFVTASNLLVDGGFTAMTI